MPMILWHIICLYSKQFHVFQQKLKSLPQRSQLFTLKEMYTINANVAIAFTYPTVFALFMVVELTLSPNADRYTDFWLLGSCEFQGVYRNIAVVFVMIAFYSSKFLITSLFIVIHGYFSYRLVKAIQTQAAILQRSFTTEDFAKEFQVYQDIVSCCELLETFFRSPIFLIISINFSIVYTGLGLALGETKKPSYEKVIEPLMTILFCVLSLFQLLFFASKIPEVMQNTSKKFFKMYCYTITKSDFRRSETVKKLVLMKLVSEMKPVYLTASGMVRLNKAALSFDKKDLYSSFWFIGYSPNPKWLRQILIFLAMNLYFSSKFLIAPVLVTLHGFLSCTLANALRMQKSILVKNSSSPRFTEEIKTYQSIVSCCKHFDIAFRAVLLLLLAIKFTAVYNGLGMALGMATDIPAAVNMAESVMTLCLCVVCIIGLVACASKVPEEMSMISNLFQEFHQNALLEIEHLDHGSMKKVLLLKMLSETRPVYLSACGMLHLNRSYVLSCFGCALSFCILIMQLNSISQESH
ncbi:hypothetical protein JTE90_014672 [Oedothorax gibbosus]|uniref:Gustatory receptor n=1 Tax=Oedothorax gibbosus TaxID=931172 RepID=A0AAV6UHR2_9ARAC|nr:hypothetical protein JTE90_014672 [Oedothorax gibbosus]